MPIFDFSDIRDDDEKKTPSQIARDSVKQTTQKKKSGSSIFDFSDIRETKSEPTFKAVEQPKPKKSFFQKAGDAIKKTVSRVSESISKKKDVGLKVSNQEPQLKTSLSKLPQQPIKTGPSLYDLTSGRQSTSAQLTPSAKKTISENQIKRSKEVNLVNATKAMFGRGDEQLQRDYEVGLSQTYDEQVKIRPTKEGKTESASKYGATAGAVDTIASLQTGVGQIISSAGQVAKWQGKDGLGDKLIAQGGEWYDKGVDTSEFKDGWEWKDAYNPRFYTTQIAQGIPFVYAMLPLSIIGGGAGATVGGVLGLSATKTLILSLISGGFLSANAEAAFEAGGTYDEMFQEAIASGKSEVEARQIANKAANKSYGGNVAMLTVSNSLQFSPFLKGTLGMTTVDDKIEKSIVSKLFKSSLVAAGEYFSEASEELGQYNIDLFSRGKSLDFTSPIAQQNFHVGGIFGLVFGAGGAIIELASGKDVTQDVIRNGQEQSKQVINEIEEELKNQIPEYNTAVEQGKSEEEKSKVLEKNEDVAKKIVKDIIIKKTIEEQQAKELVKEDQPTEEGKNPTDTTEGGKTTQVDKPVPVGKELKGKLDAAIDDYVKDSGVIKNPKGKPVETPALLELAKVAKDPKVIKITQEQIQTIPKNEDGSITLYRGGKTSDNVIGENPDRLVSAAYTRESAENFVSDSPTDQRTIMEFTVQPEDIAVYIGGTEAEVLVPGSSVVKKEEKTPEVKPTEAPKTGTESDLSTYYASQDQEAVGQAHYEVMAELEVSEAGQRLLDSDGNFAGGLSSTFPDWVPSELRTKKLFNSVIKDIGDPSKMTFPPNSQPRKQELYEVILSEIDSRAGTNSSDIIERIKNVEKETNKDAEPISSSVAGSKRPATPKEKEDLIEEADTLRGTKGLTADDIMSTYPNIKLTKDVVAKDVYGKKVTIPEGEKLTPYELKGNKILLQDGQTYLVSKNQFANIQGQSIGGEVKPFAPELQGVEETVLGVKGTDAELRALGYEVQKGMGEDVSIMKDGEDVDYNDLPPDIQKMIDKAGDVNPTKYEKYTLPGGENYREILIQSPKRGNSAATEDYITEIQKKYSSTKRSEYYPQMSRPEQDTLSGLLQSDISNNPSFSSSHWEQPNVISHLRINDRTYNDQPVTFMEELQSDWAREGRDKGFNPEKPPTREEYFTPGNIVGGLYGQQKDEVIAYYPDTGRGWSVDVREANRDGTPNPQNRIRNHATEPDLSLRGIPNSPLLKNWQETAVKRALLDAVANNSKYFAWINGEQTSARYNLSTMVDNVAWDKTKTEGIKDISLSSKTGQLIKFTINEEGAVVDTYSGADASWKGKKLDEVLGKGLADKIMSDEKGLLEGDGLKFGGEWANTLYDKQVANIVKNVTGAEMQVLDMGLPIESSRNKSVFIDPRNTYDTRYGIQPEDLGTKYKVDSELQLDRVDSDGSIRGGELYIITDITGDGKFKAIPKTHLYYLKTGKDDLGKPITQRDRENFEKEEEFDISNKTTTQQAIELTPEVVAKIKSEAVKIETSGKKFDPKPAPTFQKAVESKPTTAEVQQKAQDLQQTANPSTENIPRKPGFSRFQERMEEQLLDGNGQKYNFDETTGTYDKISLQEDAEKATTLLEKDPERAVSIAKGFEDPKPGDPTLFNISNAVALKAFDEGNIKLGTELINKISLTATRYGQNIVSLRGNFNNNTPQNFIKKVISARLDKLGNTSLVEIEKLIGKKNSAKTKAIAKVDYEVEKLKKKVNKEINLKSNKIKMAQDIIDSLKCT